MSIAAKDDVAVDADLLRDQVKSKYREVATDPHGAHHFHTRRRSGHPSARFLCWSLDDLARSRNRSHHDHARRPTY